MRVIASQKLPRDSGESIFAARHQDASQGPLGKVGLLKGSEGRDSEGIGPHLMDLENPYLLKYCPGQSAEMCWRIFVV